MTLRLALSQSRFVPSPWNVTPRAPRLSTGDWWDAPSNQGPPFTAKLLTPNSSTLVSTSLVSPWFYIDREITHFSTSEETQLHAADKTRTAAPSPGTPAHRVLFLLRNPLKQLAEANVDVSCVALPGVSGFSLYFWLTQMLPLFSLNRRRVLKPQLGEYFTVICSN